MLSPSSSLVSFDAFIYDAACCPMCRCRYTCLQSEPCFARKPTRVVYVDLLFFPDDIVGTMLVEAVQQSESVIFLTSEGNEPVDLFFTRITLLDLSSVGKQNWYTTLAICDQQTTFLRRRRPLCGIVRSRFWTGPATKNSRGYPSHHVCQMMTIYAREISKAEFQSIKQSLLLEDPTVPRYPRAF